MIQKSSGHPQVPFFFHVLHIKSLSKFCWLYFPNIFHIKPLLPSLLLPVHPELWVSCTIKTVCCLLASTLACVSYVTVWHLIPKLSALKQTSIISLSLWVRNSGVAKLEPLYPLWPSLGGHTPSPPKHPTVYMHQPTSWWEGTTESMNAVDPE